MDVIRMKTVSPSKGAHDVILCPGRSAARSGALQTRDPGSSRCKQPGSRISGAILRAAPRPGHVPLLLHHSQCGEELALLRHVLLDVRLEARRVGRIVGRLEG